MDEDAKMYLEKMLIKYYGESLAGKIIESYKIKKNVTLRVNTLKASVEEIKEELKRSSIIYKEVNWSQEALIIGNATEEEIRKLAVYDEGKIYMQGLSSMLPPIVLNPKSNENILDMTAAPGGKTTQIMAISNNEAIVTACEKNKIRAERLKYNLDKQGARRVNVMVQDARRLDEFFKFDKILLDAPCSGSGTVDAIKKVLIRS